jgi:hypothetical protein
MARTSATVMTAGSMAFNTQEAQRISHAVGWDAGNAHAAKHGRRVWSVSDYNAAARAAQRLLATSGVASPSRA